jgi:hypothetical protein
MHFDLEGVAQKYQKGYAIHQIGSGIAGKEGYPLCASMPSIGRFKYT